MTTLEYILSVLKLPFSDEDKAAMIVKLVNAGIAAGVADVSAATIGKSPTIQPAPTGAIPAPEPTPAPVPLPAPAITFHSEGGLRVDDIMPKGTPGTVYLPKTGHVVSLPQLDKGELGLGYINRVKRQLYAADLVDRAAAAMIIQGFTPTAVDAGLNPSDPNHWPEIVDRLTNDAAYLTQEQKDRAAAARAQMISGMQSVAAQQGVPNTGTTVPDPGTVPVTFENR